MARGMLASGEANRKKSTIPFFVLEKLAAITRCCVLGTRVAKNAPDGRSFAKYPVAYLLGPEECKHDNWRHEELNAS
jgi:hypothetical protein